jgi:hypothetical protein
MRKAEGRGMKAKEETCRVGTAHRLKSVLFDP